MIRNLRLTVCILVFAFFGISNLAASDPVFVPPRSVDLSEEKLDSIGTVINDAIDNGEIPHGAALVARHGKIAYLEYFGDANSSGSPLREDTIFRIASFSKIITSIAAMTLYEEGKFLMTDPISKFIPAFENSTVGEVDANGNLNIRPAIRPITVRDVLTHKAGMIYEPFISGPLSDLYRQNGVAEFFPFGRNEVLETYINRYAGTPMFTDPGASVTYGVATDVLGRLIEVWSGVSLETYFNEHIFQPLEMNDTHFFLPAEKAHRLTSMYTATAAGSFVPRLTPEVDAYLDGPRKLFGGAAGLLSTPLDFFKICQTLLDGGSYGNNRILSRKSVAMMTSDQLDGTEYPDFLRMMGDGSGFGLGVRTQRGSYDGLESIGTLSFAGIFWTRYWVDPAEDLIILAFTQSFTLDQSGWAHRVKNAAYSALE